MQHETKLKSLQLLSKTPKYNNPLNPRGSLSDADLQNYSLHSSQSSRFAKENFKAREEIEILQKELLNFRNLLDSISPGQSTRDILEALRLLPIQVEHLTKPGEAQFLKLNGRSISLSSQEGSTAIDRIDIQNSNTGRYDLACDHLGTQIVAVEKLKEESEPCDLNKVWTQLNLKNEVTTTDQRQKELILSHVKSALEKPLDEAKWREVMPRDEVFIDAADKFAKQKASEKTKIYETRYLAELKKGKRPQFVEIYKDRSNYEEFIRDPKNWNEIASKGRELQTIKMTKQIFEDFEERHDRGEKLPELDEVKEEIFTEHITRLVDFGNTRYQIGLANRKRFEQILVAAQEPGPLKITVEEYKLIFRSDLANGSVSKVVPKLSFNYDSVHKRIQPAPFLLINQADMEFPVWLSGFDPLTSFSLSPEENKEFALWSMNNRSTTQDIESLPLSEVRKVELCKALKSAL